jgi:hypothetical protein
MGNEINMNGTNVQNLQNVQNKYKTNQLMKIDALKNNFKNIANNKNNMFNIKKLNKVNKDFSSAKKDNQVVKSNKIYKNMNQGNKLKIPVNELNQLNTNTEEKDSNLMLLNTLNYKNIEKWEMSKDNLVDSIEEIFEIDEKKNVNNNLETNEKNSINNTE